MLRGCMRRWFGISTRWSEKTTFGASILILTRKVGEEILIGDGIVITVCKLGPTYVKIGIKAPSDIPVIRAELEGRPCLKVEAVP